MDYFSCGKIVVILLSASAVAGAFFAATSQKIIHSIMFFMFSLIAVSGLLLSLGAEFPALMQLIVAVSFTIALLILSITHTPKEFEKGPTPLVKWWILPALGIGILTGFIIILFYHYRSEPMLDKTRLTSDGYFTGMTEIADELMVDMRIPLVVLSISLLVTIVAALFITRKENSNGVE